MTAGIYTEITQAGSKTASGFWGPKHNDRIQKFVPSFLKATLILFQVPPTVLRSGEMAVFRA